MVKTRQHGETSPLPSLSRDPVQTKWKRRPLVELATASALTTPSTDNVVRMSPIGISRDSKRPRFVNKIFYNEEGEEEDEFDQLVDNDFVGKLLGRVSAGVNKENVSFNDDSAVAKSGSPHDLDDSACLKFYPHS